MGIEPVTGAELRQMVGIARKQPLGFAFCIGSKDDDLLFIDRRKPPSALGKEAKRQGSSPKVAFGLLTAEANQMTLACELMQPNLAKRVRKYLKSHSISAKVIVTDADGAVLDDGEDRTDSAQPDSGDAEPGQATENLSVSDRSEPEGDRQAKQKALQQLRDLVLHAARIGPAAQRHATSEAKVIAEMIKAGDLASAPRSMARLAQRITELKQEADVSATDAERPDPAVLERARTDWIAARKGVAKNVRALLGAIDVATRDEPGIQNATSQIARQFRPIAQMDTTLETLLDELGRAASDTKRSKLIVAARKQMRNHLNVANSEFFKAVDKNGFVETNIRSTITGSLRKVNDALKNMK